VNENANAAKMSVDMKPAASSGGATGLTLHACHLDGSALKNNP
jgi:hypothetical protein